MAQFVEGEATLAAANLLKVFDFGYYVGTDLPRHQVIDGPLDSA